MLHSILSKLPQQQSLFDQGVRIESILTPGFNHRIRNEYLWFQPEPMAMGLILIVLYSTELEIHHFFLWYIVVPCQEILSTSMEYHERFADYIKELE